MDGVHHPAPVPVVAVAHPVVELVCLEPEFSTAELEDCSEELLRLQSYVIKNQLVHPKLPTRDFGKREDPMGLP